MSKKKILIVDDSESLCQMMQAMIEGNGPYEVCIETNPSLALAHAKEYNPDLIILDILMPEVDGVTLAIHLKRDLQLQHIPVMFLTALAEKGDFMFGNIFGGYHVISKDVSTDKLIESIQKNLVPKKEES